MKAKKFLLLMSLLKWYLDHGLHMTKIYRVIEFSPQNCFRDFRECVSESRIENREKLHLGDTMKGVIR